MGSHLVNGQFQSDKYPTCPPGKVPLSVKDPAAQPHLWRYAQTRRVVDAEFSDDLETALRAAGFVPSLLDDIVPSREIMLAEALEIVRPLVESQFLNDDLPDDFLSPVKQTVQLTAREWRLLTLALRRSKAST